MNVPAILISFVLLSSIELACCSTLQERFQSLESLQADSRGDGTSWIVGKYCMDPEGDWPVITHRDYSEKPVKDLEAAKKECADECDLSEDCKYAELYWLPGGTQTKVSKRTFGIHNTKYMIHSLLDIRAHYH